MADFESLVGNVWFQGRMAYHQCLITNLDKVQIALILFA